MESPCPPREEGNFTNSHGRKIHTYTWKPQGEPRAIVFLCHGYAERLFPYYEAVAKSGAAKGLLCFGHDHTGHGLSEGDRVQVAGMDEYVKPVIEHCNTVVTQYPGLPLYILGHSLGGLIALLTVLETQDSNVFTGMVLMGPLIELDPNLAGGAMKFMAMLVSKIWPSLSLKGLDPKQVTSSPEWLKKKEEDELHYQGGAKALHAHVLVTVLDSLPKQFAKVTTPYIIVHGAEDKICSPKGSENLHAGTSSKDKTLKVIPGGLHNLFLEPEPIQTQAVDSCIDWILERL